MDLASLRDSLREMLGDETQPYLWSDTTLTRFLNNAVREACIRARLLKDDAASLPAVCSLVLKPGVSMLKFNPAVLVVRSGSISGSCHPKLWAVSAESMDKLVPDWGADESQGSPSHMVMDLAQKTIRLYPTPDKADTLRLRVWRMPLENELMESEGDEPVIALPDPEELRHWAAHEAYLVKDSETFDSSRSGDHLALFERRFGSRPTLHDMARWADSPPRVRHASMF